ncbi:MAG: EAL domain-containing protein [Rhizobiaceae bacterium]|nr:EAL domain-containing protein [Rhizobiaceae bacterium]
MSYRSILAHIIREENGTSSGVWGPFVLKSAFQPIFAFHEGRLSIAAFEGLIRPHRDGQPVSPGAFFSALQSIDRLAVETLSRTLHLLNAGACLPRQPAIFVNFDPSVFLDRSIANAALVDMKHVLSDAGVDPRRIVCEVTEQKSKSQEALSTFVGILRGNGFRIAVDDYGAEDSDIERIKSLKPEIVKFDAHWITRLMESGPGFGLLSAMVAIFAERGITTVFEGIEENWQLELAEKSGAAMVQGYVLARPEIAPTSFAAFPTVPFPGVTPTSRRLPPPAAAAPRESAPRAVRLVPKTFGRRLAP